MKSIKSGDKVELNSGGPPMTVRWVEDDDAYCDWFDDRNELKSAPFSVAQLTILQSYENK